MVISFLNGISQTLSLYYNQKDKSDPSSYRSISLTRCICKIMEYMVNSWLTGYLERNKIIAAMQSGFRKRRSTRDQLVRLKTFINFVRLLLQNSTLWLYFST